MVRKAASRCKGYLAEGTLNVLAAVNARIEVLAIVSNTSGLGQKAQAIIEI